MISALLALISYVIVILVGLTCLAVEEKMHMLISTFTNSFHFCTFCTDSFVNVFYSALLKIVWEQIFHFQTILDRKCDWKRDMLRKKMFSYVISRSSKVNQGHLGLLIFWYPHWLSCGQKWWEYENVLQRYAHICSQLGNLGPFGPTVNTFFYQVVIDLRLQSGNNAVATFLQLSHNLWRFSQDHLRCLWHKLHYIWNICEKNGIDDPMN